MISVHQESFAFGRFCPSLFQRHFACPDAADASHITN